jgi:hypothetical protein
MTDATRPPDRRQRAEPRRSAFADAESARRALAFALPAFVAALDDPRVSGTACLSIVVLDPACDPASGGAEPCVLLEYAVGRERWDVDYAAFARAKAATAWRTGHDGTWLLDRGVATLRAGDSLLRGSAVLDGIVVAVSGAQPWYDEAIALTVAAWLRAVALERQHDALVLGQFVA